MATVPAKIRLDDTKEQGYSETLLEAANEAKRISHDADVPGYTNMEDLKKAL